MKSNETLVPCPVCGKMIGQESVNRHIANLAWSERKSKLADEKRHNNYKFNLNNYGLLHRTNPSAI